MKSHKKADDTETIEELKKLLDQKNRELEIEAALERVRARTMSMKRSDELKDVVFDLYKQLDELGLADWGCEILLFDEVANRIENWVAESTGSDLSCYIIEGQRHPVYERLWQHWRQQGPPLKLHHIDEEKLDFDNFWLNETGFRSLPDEVKKSVLSEREVFLCFINMRHGMISTAGYIDLPEEKISILQRFAKVFEQTYTRFLDLQKAENQAKEAQIEASLERIRSRTMAMQSSNELAEVSNLIFNQLKDLGGALISCGVVLCDRQPTEHWMSGPVGEMLPSLHIPKDLDIYLANLYKAWENQEELFFELLDENELRNHNKALRTVPEVAAIFEAFPEAVENLPPFQFNYAAPFKQGYILVITTEQYKEDYILPRFAKVFEQTYTRFLDLQKVEAQARESEIQLSLERVRARTMAMHKTEGLIDVIKTVFMQFGLLKVRADVCFINIHQADSNDWNLWVSTGAGQTYHMPVFPYFDNLVFRLQLQARERGDIFYTSLIDKESKDQFFDHFFKHLTDLDVPKSRLDYLYKAKGIASSFTISRYATIALANYSCIPYTEEENLILQRIGTVFEQTYTRFLDLQKAEVQAREAQIEAALERIRSASMAMHKSEELPQVALTFLIQIEELAIPVLGVGLSEINAETNSCVTYFADNTTKGKNRELTISKEFEIKEFWLAEESIKQMKSGKKEFTITAEGERLELWIQWIDKKFSKKRAERLRSANLYKVYFHTLQFHEYSSIIFSSLTPLNEEYRPILQRLVATFKLSYLRFLDLQKAEEQARESEIQLALERVRARTMAMHRSDELIETASQIFKQLEILGIKLWTFGINVWVSDQPLTEGFATSASADIMWKMKVPHDVDPIHIEIYEYRNQNIPLYYKKLNGEQLKKHIQYMLDLIGETQAQKISMSDVQIPSEFHFYAAYFNDGYLLFVSDHEIPEGRRLFPRFAKVFEQTYTRFLDLKKAEAQAQEAQIEASLERVRTSAMAMHESEELASVSDVLYKELKQLGVAQSATCGFVIIDEQNNIQHIYGSPAGRNFLEYFKCPLSGDIILRNRYKAWKNEKPVFHQKVGGQKLQNHLSVVLPDEETSEVEKVAKMDMPDPTHFYIANFLHGYLQIIASDILSDDQIKLLPRFAKVFEQAYTRFLDLQKAEAQAREAQIEAALERIRSRSMGMQKSEELREVIQLVFEQFIYLGFKIDSAQFDIRYMDTDDLNMWVAVPGQPYSSKLHVPYLDHVVFNDLREAKETKSGFLAVQYSFDEKNEFFEHFFKFVPGIPKERQEYILNCAGLARSTVLMETINLGIQNYLGIPFSEAENLILRRFGKVFEQTYTRFLDLQNAEAQAREAQIEAALERVRARTMAMHKSEELNETAQILFEEVTKLDIHHISSGICIMEADQKTGKLYFSFNGLLFPFAVPINYLNDKHLKEVYKHWKKGDAFFIDDLEGQALIEHNMAMAEFFQKIDLSSISDQYGLKESFQAVSERQKSLRREIIHLIYFDKGAMFFITETEPISQTAVLKRFAKVFEQTYTRFLDLQKAEAQARESEIQLALERVRARTMAMQKSSELAETASVLFQQLFSLGIKPGACAFSILNEQDQTGEVWITSDGNVNNRSYIHPYHTDPAQVRIFEAWKSGKTYHIDDLKNEELFNHIQFLSKHMPIFDMLDSAGDAKPERIVLHAIYFLQGFIGLTYDSPQLEHIPTLIRFARVFEQTYTRFLDLQKAEDQAREAEIQLALERVRARTMAMQQSDELKEVVAEVFDKLLELGFGLENGAAIIHIFNKDTKDHIEWIADPSQVFPIGIKMPFFENLLRSDIFNGWQSGVKSYSKEYSKKVKDDFFAFTFKNTKYKNIADSIKQAINNTEKYSYTIAFGENTAIGIPDIIGRLFTGKETEVLSRFAKVFDQTYTRFLDLQKAEKQARDAQIEAAMERIRSRSLAMRTSDEIMDVIVEIRRQIDSLGQLDLEASVVHLYEKGNPMFESIAAVRPPGESGKIVLANVFFPVDAMERIKDMMDHYWSDGTEYTLEFDKEMAEEWQQVMLRYAPMIAERRVGFVENRRISDHSEFWNFADFSEGSLLLVTHSPASEDTKTVLRKAAQVFDLAYRRYRDLQKAEERAKEAIKQASLDRVRGEIASMRNIDDLDRITPLIWNELTALGVSFIRCGVFIIDQEKETVNVYLSDPHGKSLGVMNLSFGSNDLTSNTVNAWKKYKVYHQFWDKDAFNAWTESLVSQGIISDKQKYRGKEEAPESLNLNFIPFTQGMLYVGTAETLPEDGLELVKSLAKTFSLAYSRYEDFVRLETAKTAIESTLSELKITQAQLIQSEKMASLGELTAGIAHEIQNPLNFVNNFSEVSAEMIDELMEVFQNQDVEEADIIANDLKRNLEKINHHGKRADSIVKGMLMHSRSSKGEKIPTDINALCDEFLRLSYHGLRAKDRSFNSEFEMDFDESIPKIEVVPQDIGRVLLNLFNNAFQACNENREKRIEKRESRIENREKRIENRESREENREWSGERISASQRLSVSTSLSPKVTVRTKNLGDKIEISVIDNGPGIPDDIKDKIFQPFFTTKPTGQGTGLGLSLAYDIVKAHSGEIKLDSNMGSGTNFYIYFPIT